MPQIENLTDSDLRNQLQQMVLADLLGPAGGPTEEIEEDSVRSRYIVGMLAPHGQTALPDEQEELAQNSDRGETEQDGVADAPAAPLPAMLPSSIGLTCTVTATTGSIHVTARWGKYDRIRSEILPPNDRGEPPLVWKRFPIEASIELPLREGKIDVWSPSNDYPEVIVTGRMRQYDSAWSVTLFLVNGQTEPKTRKDEAWIFQPEIELRASDHSAIFIKRPLVVHQNKEPETEAMEMSYRKQVEFAVGHGIAVHAEVDSNDWSRAVEIKTCVVPTHEVEQVEAPSMPGVELDMKVLSQLSSDGFGSALNPLADAYERWIDHEFSLIAGDPSIQPYTQVARTSLESCRTTLNRIRDGIRLLQTDVNAANAFCFANQAMSDQRLHSIFAGKVRLGQQISMQEIDLPENRTWRPFQLAFLLLNIPSLLDLKHPDRNDPTNAKADLLWFPTGGGKTEAYLGVAAFTMALRRLQGDIGGYSGAGGVTVIMRYTLRLLTLQQFQRATALICAMELIRKADSRKWGMEPFRIGLWVGMKSTPNRTEESALRVSQSHGNWMGRGGKGTPLQLTNCPWCGKPLGPNCVRVEVYKKGRGRTFQHCSDPMGQCPFSMRQSPDEGLPIVVVDEEIYRRLPTLLIATVDKFAQMPWKGETQMLFGKVAGKCPRHGYYSSEIEDASSHPAIHGNALNFPAVHSEECLPLRPPDLIIQDELHLISGPLGTLVGLYETAVDRLCSWDFEGVRVRPKVIASTATIRRAQNQVHNLFLRDVQIFPPSGLDSNDNFFSRRKPISPEKPGRQYLGICAPGVRMKTILIRVYVAYLAAAQKLLNLYGGRADPWMTLVGYFNSMRELGGMRRVTDDAVRTRLRKMDERGLAKRFIDSANIEELTSRKSAVDIPNILDRLEKRFPAIHRQVAPYDVVLATNMISVGVDVSRLGLMIVASQPKATSEYIQATSRVGRAFPGVVCTVYNWARPRDLSHYERFEHYHATFYQQVEALSVTPFSPRALDRGLSGVYVSQMRLLAQEFNPNEAAGRFSYPNSFIDEVEKSISDRAGLVTLDENLRSDTENMLKARRDEWLSKAQNRVGSTLSYSKGATGREVPLLKQPTENGEGYFFCLNSLRDVEPQVVLVLRDDGMDTPPPPQAVNPEIIDADNN